MDIDIEALELVALATRSGLEQLDYRDRDGWYGAEDMGIDRGCGAVDPLPDCDGAFIAAVSPAVLLEMTRRLKAAKDKVEAIRPLAIDRNKSEEIMLEQIHAAESLTGQKTTYHHVVMRAFRETIKTIIAASEIGRDTQ